MITTLMGKNRVTLPAELIAELGLKRGARLEWLVDKKRGRLIAKVQPSRGQLLARAREIGRKTKRDGRDSAVNLAQWREREDTERAECLVREKRPVYRVRKPRQKA